MSGVNFGYGKNAYFMIVFMICFHDYFMLLNAICSYHFEYLTNDKKWHVDLECFVDNMRSTEKLHSEVPDFKSWASTGRAFQVKLKLLGG